MGNPFVLDLTDMPPSVNSIWRSGIDKRTGKPRVYLDASYRSWKLGADGDYWASGKKAKFTGPVKVEITLNHTRKRGDCDNRIKVVADYLQRAGIVENDKQISDIRAHWGECKKACRIVVEALDG